MKKVKYLPENGKISLIAPSFGCVTEPYKTRLGIAIQNLKDLGYQIDEGENIYLANSKARSNTPRKCAKEFMKAYLSDSDVVVSVGGGELMDEILPYVDFEKIKKVPGKIFMGFSDNTNLTYTLTTICDVPSIYGANAGAFAFTPFEYATLDSYLMITGKKFVFEGYPVWERYKTNDDNPLAKSNFSEKKVIFVYPKKDYFEFEGKMIGGNLDIITNLCGTRFDKTKEYLEKYKEDGFIWFLEACDLNVMSIERALFQLKEAGYFKYVKGFLIGRPLCYGEKMFSTNHKQAVLEQLKKLNVPILIDIDLGHFEPTMPIFTGLKANVKYKNNNITIEYLEKPTK